MRVQRIFALVALLLACAWLLPAQGLETNAAKDDWEEVNFEFNSSILSDGYPSLLRLAELLHQHPDFKVKLDGNTDSVGSHRYNDKLSQARAEAVKKFLVKYGAVESQILQEAHGKRAPKVDNTTKEGRFMNRRVTMTVTDGKGKIVSAGGVADAIKAIQAAEPARDKMCCQDILSRLDKLDEILAAIKDLKAQNEKLRQDVAGLQQKQAVAEQKVAELPKAPDKAEMQQMMRDTVAQAIDKTKPSRFSLLGVNIGPSLTDVYRPGWERDTKMAGKGNFTITGRGRYFAPFGQNQTSAVQAEGEYLYFHDRQEGQFDVGLVNRWNNMQLGLFNSLKYVHIADLHGGGTLGQGALTLDYLFKYGRIGMFGTKGYRNEAVLARTPVTAANGLVTYNVFDESYIRNVDQIGASTTVGLWKDTYMDANFGALFRHGGSNRPGGMVRLVQPINSFWAFTVEAGVNETMVGPSSTGRVAIGVQLGNWLKPKQYTEVKHAVPSEIPRLRYELLTRRVHVGNAPPVADAGPDQIGVSAGTITLDGSGSYDPDGDAMTYQWTQIAGPSVTLSAATAAKTTFSSAEGQSYSFRLTVKDSQGAQGTARVTVTTTAAGQVRIVQFTANPATITSGQASTLQWQVENAETVQISSVGNVNKTNGTTSVSPTQTTTYTLTATNKNGSVTSTATVTVTQQSAPVIVSFQANPASITQGQSSVLLWQTQNADSVSISSVGTVAQNGSTAVTPTQTTTYTLTAVNKSGQATASVTVTVGPGQNNNAPAILAFTANPSQIILGGTSTLAWQVTNATEVTITSIGSVGLTGNQGVSPTVTTTYTLTAKNASGQVTANATVTVLAAAKILSFTANPSTITAGQSTTLSWTTQNAVSATLQGIGPVDVNGSVQVSPTVTTTYTLTAVGSTGAPAGATVTVTVNPVGPTVKPPIANAGGDRLVNVREVTLNAGASIDPQGQALTYSWVAADPSVYIQNPASVVPLVQLGTKDGPYRFTLTVTNASGLTSSTSVTITLVRTAPVPIG